MANLSTAEKAEQMAKIIAFPKDAPEDRVWLWKSLLVETERESCRLIARAVIAEFPLQPGA